MRDAARWTILLVVAASFTLATWAEAQPAGSARLLLARPPVEVIARGQTAVRPVARGDRLSEGDRVRTGQGGAAEIELGDGSIVRLGELSDLEIDKLDVDAAGLPATSRFNLAAGRARAWVAKQVVAKVATGQGRFSVQTPTAVAAVRQTDFAVVHELNPGTKVYAFAGAVEVSGARPDISVLLTRNRFTEVAPGQNPTPPRIIPFFEKRSLFKVLSIEAVNVPGPHDLDRDMVNSASKKLSEKMTGERAGAGSPARTGRTDASTTSEVPVTIIVTTD